MSITDQQHKDILSAVGAEAERQLTEARAENERLLLQVEFHENAQRFCKYCKRLEAPRGRTPRLRRKIRAERAKKERR